MTETIRRANPRQSGATYLAVMIAVAVISSVLAATAQVVSHAQQRDRETQLLWVGEQFRRALIEYAKTGVGMNAFPKSLEDLLQDNRQLVKRSYLRKIYIDPITASKDWGLVLNPQERIIGVFSKSTKKPIRTGNFPAIYASFQTAATYADWKFAVGDLPGTADKAKDQGKGAQAGVSGLRALETSATAKASTQGRAEAVGNQNQAAAQLPAVQENAPVPKVAPTEIRPEPPVSDEAVPDVAPPESTE